MKRASVTSAALALTLSLGLAACGADEESPNGTGAEAPADESTEDTADAGTDGETDTEDTTAEDYAAEDTAGGDTAEDTAGGDTVMITDAQGREVEVPVNPETLVVTDWNIIRTLSDLGVSPDAIPAPVSALPEDVNAAVEGLPEIGTVFEPDYEAIAAMEPDLVIVGSRSGNPEVVAEMEKFATVVDLSTRPEEDADPLTDMRERVEQVGQIVDHEAEASALMDELDSQVTELHDEIAAQGEKALMVQVSDGTVSAYGPGSRFGLIYGLFGYSPIDAPLDAEGGHGDEISQEFFVQYDPEVLFVLDRGKAVGQEATPAMDLLSNGLANSTTAFSNDRVVEVDGFSWYLATYAPSSFQQIIDDVRASL